MWTGCQRGGQQNAPVSAGIRGTGAHQRRSFINVHRGKRLAGTNETRNGVVGALSGADRAGDRAHVINRLADNRRVRRSGIHHQRKVRRCGADVARRIGGRDGPGVAAIRQRGGRGKAPRAAAVSLGGADLLAVLIDRDGRVGRGCAVKGWGGVVRALPGGERCLNAAHVIARGQNGRRCRGGGIHRQVNRCRRAAGIACCIGGVEGNGMWSFGERRARGEGPVPLSIDDRGANLAAINNDVHRGTDFARAVEGGFRVVGAAAAGERPGDRTDIVNHAGDHRRGRTGGINREDEDRRVG